MIEIWMRGGKIWKRLDDGYDCCNHTIYNHHGILEKIKLGKFDSYDYWLNNKLIKGVLFRKIEHD